MEAGTDKCQERRRIELHLSQGCNVKDYFANTGIETQPRAEDEIWMMQTRNKHIIAETINVTATNTNQTQVFARKAHMFPRAKLSRRAIASSESDNPQRRVASGNGAN